MKAEMPRPLSHLTLGRPSSSTDSLEYPPPGKTKMPVRVPRPMFSGAVNKHRRGLSLGAFPSAPGAPSAHNKTDLGGSDCCAQRDCRQIAKSKIARVCRNGSMIEFLIKLIAAKISPFESGGPGCRNRSLPLLMF